MQYYKNAMRYTKLLLIFVLFLAICSTFIKNKISDVKNVNQQLEAVMQKQLAEEKERLKKEYDEALQKQVEEITASQNNQNLNDINQYNSESDNSNKIQNEPVQEKQPPAQVLEEVSENNP